MTESFASPRATYRARLAVAARAAIDPARDGALRQQAWAEVAALIADLAANGRRETLQLAQRVESTFALQGPLSVDAAPLVSELMTALEQGPVPAVSVDVAAEPRRSRRS